MGCTPVLLMPCALLPFPLSTESPLHLEEGRCIQQTKMGAEIFPFSSSPLSLPVCRKLLSLQVQGEIGEVDGKGLLNRENPHPAQEVPELRKLRLGEILGKCHLLSQFLHPSHGICAWLLLGARLAGPFFWPSSATSMLTVAAACGVSSSRAWS